MDSQILSPNRGKNFFYLVTSYIWNLTSFFFFFLLKSRFLDKGLVFPIFLIFLLYDSRMIDNIIEL